MSLYQASIWIMVLMPIIGGVVSYAIGTKNEKARDIFARAVETIEFLLAAMLFINAQATTVYTEVGGFAALGLHFEADGFRSLYAMVSAFAWMVACYFAGEYLHHDEHRNRFYLFMLITLGATEGVFLSADFYTLFLFFEMMSFASYVWVTHEENKGALRAASTYLAVAVIGGLVMLMGLFMMYQMAGTLNIDDLFKICRATFEEGSSAVIKRIYIAGFCMLFGFGAKAGAFPLHIWLPKAHPVAPAPFSALLSGILTKAGMFGILALSCNMFYEQADWGNVIMIIGVFTMLIGAILAIFSIDLKRTLACSSVSQIGFILVGVGVYDLLGEEGSIAITGSLLHMVNHSLFKLVLFASAGVVFMNLHKLDLNEVRGFGRNKKLLKVIFALGSLGIMCIPGFSGYVSKTLIHEGIVEYAHLLLEGEAVNMLGYAGIKAIEYLFLFSGGCTICYMIKLFVCVFVEKNASDTKQKKYDGMNKYMNMTTGIFLLVPACLFPLFGCLPTVIMAPMAQVCHGLLHNEPLHVEYYSLENLKGSLTSIIIGVALYCVVRVWLIKKENDQTVYVNRWPEWLDLENVIYRPVLLKILPAFCGFFCRILDSLIDTIVVILRKTIYSDAKIPYELDEGTIFTQIHGVVANWWLALGNSTWNRNHPREEHDYVHEYAAKRERDFEQHSIVLRSMSFGLMLFCIGMFITIGYLLLF